MVHTRVKSVSNLALAYDSARPKFALASLALIIIGITFMILPVQATNTINSVSYSNLAGNYSAILGAAQPNYIVAGTVSATGTVHVQIVNIDTDSVLFDTWVSNNQITINQIVPQAGSVQVKVTPSSYLASSTFNFALTNPATTYPLLIPGVALLVLGAAIILTRVIRIGITVSNPTPSQPI